MFPYINKDSREEVVLANARFGGSMFVSKVYEETMKGDKQIAAPLLMIITEWRALLGIAKNQNAEEIILVFRFVAENFNFLTVEEIEIAVNLSIMGRFKDVEFKGFFSAEYASRVLNAYWYYSKVRLAEAYRRRELHLQAIAEEKNRPTPKQEADSKIEFLTEAYNQWQETGKFRDPFNILYRFFVKKGFMNPQKYLSEAEVFGKKEGKISYDKLNENRYIDDGSAVYKKEVESFTNNGCVNLYFKENSLKSIIDKIRPDIFFPIEEQVAFHKQNLSTCYNQFKSNGEIVDNDCYCYTFLRKHKELFNFIITRQTINDALAYGKKKTSDEQKANIHARNYCVQNYFKDVDIVVLLNKVTPNLFN